MIKKIVKGVGTQKKVKKNSDGWSAAERKLKKIWQEKIPRAKPSDFYGFVNRAINQKNILLKSAKKFATPQYILDEKMLVENALVFKSAFEKRLKHVKVFYAFKCNDLPYAIKKLKSAGIHADVSSLFELELALKLGFKEIIFTGPGKSQEELMLAAENSDRVILNIDNFDELKKVIIILNKKKTKNLRISFRLNSDIGIMGKWSKFGFSLNEFKVAVKTAKNCKYLDWIGVHFHCSWNKNPEKYVKNIKTLGAYLKENFSKKELSRLRFLDIGGGFMTNASTSLFSSTDKATILNLVSEEETDAVIQKNLMTQIVDPKSENPESISFFAEQISSAINLYFLKKLSLSGIEVYLEPGRFIASTPTYILLKVECIKGENIITDGGISIIGSADFRYDFFPIVNLSRPSHEFRKATIYGPLCDPDDLWGYYYFGRACKKGDILAVMHQGAYTFSTAWRFIRPIAKYIAFSGNKLTIAKKEEAFENRYAGCRF